LDPAQQFVGGHADRPDLLGLGDELDAALARYDDGGMRCEDARTPEDTKRLNDLEAYRLGFLASTHYVHLEVCVDYEGASNKRCIRGIVCRISPYEIKAARKRAAPARCPALRLVPRSGPDGPAISRWRVPKNIHGLDSRRPIRTDRRSSSLAARIRD
jgi:hypothetical protein